FLDSRDDDGAPAVAGATVVVPVAGRLGVPDDAAAAVVSVTAVTPDGAGFATLYPCDGDPEQASTLNYLAGQYVPNGAIAQLSDDGELCVFTSAESHLLL